MNKAEQFINERLLNRTEKGSLRKLSAKIFPVDFCSNDYLGFARSPQLKNAINETLLHMPHYGNGAAGSRLLSGNHAFTEETEAFIADFHNAENGLVFNSGYDANVGLISSLAQRGDTIISDELIHASLIDGARLTHANRYSFKHNNLNDLEAKLKVAKGNVYVVVESVYSMDGDVAPLTEINSLCERYEANLIVDEAHALGIFGNYGRGLVQQAGLENKVFARIVTFGKALGCHGAIVLGSRALRNYLINFARSFIYSTAAPIHAIAAIRSAYQMLTDTDYRPLIAEKIALYSRLISNSGIQDIQPSPSTIQTIIYNSNQKAKFAAETLQNKGIDVRAILSPTVAEGKERLRICLHLFNTDEEIKMLVDQLILLKEHE
ncbi:pyridoxal phosphate-dependent aminotransferase family protein [Pedobacter panaciterrae]|jgi:7-keto-8-aminopelargonate synthetase and related enzymes|uniref:aminotransferase class I/II-fold pyridoxal phosphate-dependent enzyme n=1 Tax=Pedobacter panaciterrae TaxID=363849 RepID=UPI00155DDC54|nr:pyridoxal phosphate-dependent aminotransferase family protein [Pedobacter panaciterrae]NQX56599.1 pyridoxal phosphate-dependent aminotransferase family protein [Pedobacter panaciterrae]